MALLVVSQSTATAYLRTRVTRNRVSRGLNCIYSNGKRKPVEVYPCLVYINIRPTCVRFPWQRDVGALSRNNGIVQHCCVSLAMQQLKRRAYQQATRLRTQQ
jgi:hypothetical protein